MTEILFWALITFLCIAMEAFFTMSEMSFVSFDKVRLHFLEAKGIKRAKLLLKLLQKTHLFVWNHTYWGELCAHFRIRSI